MVSIKRCDGKDCKSTENVQEILIYNGRIFDGYDRYEDNCIHVDLCPMCLLKYTYELQNKLEFIDSKTLVDTNKKYFSYIKHYNLL